MYDQMRFTILSTNQIKSNVGFRGEGKTGYFWAAPNIKTT